MTFLTDSIDSTREQRDALRTALMDLTRFIDSDDFMDASLDGFDRQSLRTQAAAERALLDILNERITRYDSNIANEQPQVLSAPGLIDAHTPQAANTVYAPERPITIDDDTIKPVDDKAALDKAAADAEAQRDAGQTVTEQADATETNKLPDGTINADGATLVNADGTAIDSTKPAA